MDYIRSFDIGLLDAGRFDYQMLADLETCYVIVCRSPTGSGGPDTHVHDCDQFYYVLDGTMNVVLGETEYTAEPESLVFIPRGTTHRNWTVGAQPETHIDILVPPPARGQAMSRPADPHKTGPSAPCVCHADEARAMSGPDGQVVTPIAAPRGAAGMAVNVVRAGTAAPTASWHIHNFDQLYWILEGTLTVEIAGERHDVTPGNLVVLPAGVPHRNWNEADTVERHLAFLVPASAGQPVTRSVTFGLGVALRSWLHQEALASHPCWRSCRGIADSATSPCGRAIRFHEKGLRCTSPHELEAASFSTQSSTQNGYEDELEMLYLLVNATC